MILVIKQINKSTKKIKILYYKKCTRIGPLHNYFVFWFEFGSFKFSNQNISSKCRWSCATQVYFWRWDDKLRFRKKNLKVDFYWGNFVEFYYFNWIKMGVENLLNNKIRINVWIHGFTENLIFDTFLINSRLLYLNQFKILGHFLAPWIWLKSLILILR